MKKICGKKSVVIVKGCLVGFLSYLYAYNTINSFIINHRHHAFPFIPQVGFCYFACHEIAGINTAGFSGI